MTLYPRLLRGAAADPRPPQRMTRPTAPASSRSSSTIDEAETHRSRRRRRRRDGAGYFSIFFAVVALHCWHDPAVEATRRKAITRTTIPLSTIRVARRPSSCSSSNGDPLELSTRVRGGGSGDDDAATTSGATLSTAKENDGTAEATDAAEKRSFSARFLGSLFDLSNDVKAEAAEDTSTTAVSAEDDKIGRGGALVTAKPTRSLPRWLGALDNSRVAPFALRWLPRAGVDNDDDEREAPKALPRTTTSTKTASRSVTERVVARAKSVQKVWWVDTWADQLPTSEQDEEKLLAVVEEQKLERRSTMDVVAVKNASAVELTETKPEEVKEKDHDEDEEINVEQASSSFPSLPGDDEEKVDAIAQNRSIALEWEAEVVAETLVAIESEAEAATKKHHSKKKKKHKTHKKEDAKGEAVLDAVSNATTLEGVSGPSADQQNVSTSSDSNVSIAETSPVSAYVSSGYWQSIDRALTLGFAETHPSLRLSSHLRTVRKAAAHVTGLHGVLSGKPRRLVASESEEVRRRLAAIDRAKRNVERAAVTANQTTKKRFFWRRKEPEYAEQLAFIREQTTKERLAEERRKDRVKAIDKKMKDAQELLMQLACEKDVLQRRPNPLWSYATDEAHPTKVKKNQTEVDGSVAASRTFKFPSEDLVDEYLDMLFSSGRLCRLNHTDLWRNDDNDDYDDEDEFLSPTKQEEDRRRRNGNGGSGSWLLRNGIGEKIGATVETAAYKAVCGAVMSLLARIISGFHGINVMTYSDIRLTMEQAPDLPPITAGMIPGSGRNRNYAHDAIQDAVRRGARNYRKKKRRRSEDNFVQRDAVVETLASQCLIAAPLLNLFPIAWQRAIISNVVTMAMAVVTDFCEGLEFQILGHRLSIAFSPITEEDMLRGMVMDSYNNRRRTNPDEFEAAVRATAEEVDENLKIFDRWHERALGSGMLRTQIATLIARLVLSLTDDILSGARMDLWASQAGGPRLRAGLEYRTTKNPMDEAGRS